MFKIDDVVIYWINCSSNTKRHEHMLHLLNIYFPNNPKHHIEAVMHKPKYQGVTMAHTIALMKGLDGKKPFLILEDDVDVDQLFFKGEVEKKLNEKVDAIYLGISAWGKNKKMPILKKVLEKNEKVVCCNNKIFFFKGAVANNLDDLFFKIQDMFGAHAILYVNHEYVVKTLKICILAIGLNKPHDIFLPSLIKRHNVIGLKNCWFYQNAKIGGQERATKIDFADVRSLRVNL